MCGRAIGYHYGTVDAFGFSAVGQENINTYYVYGISIAHGTPRNHIWTFADGLSEEGHTAQAVANAGFHEGGDSIIVLCVKHA